MDDSAVGFSKRKYENRNDKLRRMGAKKKQMNSNKIKHKRANSFKSSKGNKGKGK